MAKSCHELRLIFFIQGITNNTVSEEQIAGFAMVLGNIYERPTKSSLYS